MFNDSFQALQDSVMSPIPSLFLSRHEIHIYVTSVIKKTFHFLSIFFLPFSAHLSLLNNSGGWGQELYFQTVFTMQASLNKNIAIKLFPVLS